MSSTALPTCFCQNHPTVLRFSHVKPLYYYIAIKIVEYHSILGLVHVSMRCPLTAVLQPRIILKTSIDEQGRIIHLADLSLIARLLRLILLHQDGMRNPHLILKH